jgi:LytS/YehU family sensor histidine kinase
MHLEDKHKHVIRIAGIVILCIILLLIIPVSFHGNNHSEKDILERKILTICVIITGWLMNVLNLIFLYPVLAKWKENRWFSLYLPSYLLMIGISCVGYAIITKISKQEISPFFSVMPGIAINTMILVTIELILSKYEEARIKLENAELKMISLQAQHEKLKHQLHPHFLFNSLNALKTLIKKNPGQAEKYLIKLSEFLRFSITHNEQNFVCLKEELQFSLHYLEMQKTRFPDCLFYKIDIPGEIIASGKLPAFSLQLLLENAIKHNALTNEFPLHICITHIPGDHLLVENNVTAKLVTEPGAGLGLKNLSQRYLLLAQEDIQIKTNGNCFQVYLKIL